MPTSLNAIGLCLLTAVAVAVAQTSSTPASAIDTVMGRRAFTADEPIQMLVRGDGMEASVSLRTGDGRERTLTVPLNGGVGWIEIEPLALSPGVWSIEAGGHRLEIEVADSNLRTPFVFCAYQGSLADGQSPFFVKAMPGDERMKLWRDTYGINFAMYPARAGVEREVIDRFTLAGIRYTTAFSVAGQHQPVGPHHCWADPDVMRSSRHQVMALAQQWRRWGEGFAGVHYADEPGLTYGILLKDGRKGRYYQGSHVVGDMYFGPLAVAVQDEQYQQITGRAAPDTLNPDADLDAWLDYMRWRTTILGDAFTQLTEAVHRVDQKLLGYSQVYAWSAIVDGSYPPEMGRGVDVLSTHAYAPWAFLGQLYPPHEVDAMRSGARDKPLWMMPTWMNHQSEVGGVRALVYGTLARKMEGLTWPLDWIQAWPEAEEVARRIVPLSAALREVEAARGPVAVLHSRDEHLRAAAKDLRNSRPGLNYAGLLMTAWATAAFAGYTPIRVTEGDLVAGVDADIRVILAPALTDASDEVRAALSRFIEAGGTLLLDKGATLDIAGAGRLPFTFPDGFDTDWLKGDTLTDRLVFDRLIEPNVAALRAALRPIVAPIAEADAPMVWFGQQRGGDATYLWVLNHTQTHDPAKPFNSQPVTTTVRWPEGGVMYDAFDGERVADKTKLRLELAPGEGRLFVAVPRPIALLQLTDPQWTGDRLQIDAAIHDESGVMDAVLPVSIELIQPDGQRHGRYERATRGGRMSATIALGRAPLEGRWRVKVTDLLSGMSQEAAINITGEDALRARTLQVSIHDGPRIATALRTSEKPVLVMHGEAESSVAAAKRIAADLNGAGVAAEIAAASDHMTFDSRGERDLPFLQGHRPLTLDRTAIVVGGRADNPLAAWVADKLDLAPWPVNVGEPPQGTAVVFRVAGVLSGDAELISVHAADGEGRDRGIDAMFDLVREK